MSAHDGGRAKYRELLRALKTTVGEILEHDRGARSRLHGCLEDIFKHGCRGTDDNSSDYWPFIQNCERLQPDPASSKSNNNDRASRWLHQNIENNSLSQKLPLMLTNKSNVQKCYTEHAFLCQAEYAEATLLCLKALKHNQGSFLMKIKKHLYVLPKIHHQTALPTTSRSKRQCLPSTTSPAGEETFSTSVLDLEQAIKYATAKRTWPGSEPWLESAVSEVTKRCAKLSDDITEDSYSWTYAQYCAHHYYTIARYYYNELYTKHSMDLETIRICLRMCVEKLAEDPQGQVGHVDKIRKLRQDAEKFLTDVNSTNEKQNQLLNKHYSKNNIRGSASMSISLGYVDSAPLQKCSLNDRTFFEKKVANIQLLRVIYTLSNAITLSDGDPIDLDLTEHLNQLYQFAGLERKCNLKTSCLEYPTMKVDEIIIKDKTVDKKIKDDRDIVHHKIVIVDYTDKVASEKDINEIVFDNISQREANVAQVITSVEKHFNKEVLSSTDIDYIEKEYMKCCSRLWLNDITNILKTLHIAAKHNIRQVIGLLTGVECLNEVPSSFHQKYYQLLITHPKLINKRKEKRLINAFKKLCWEETVGYRASVERELLFLEAFVTFLWSTKNYKLIIAQLDVVFLESFADVLRFIKELDVNVYGNSLTNLQDKAKYLQLQLQQDDCLFLVDAFKEVLVAYVKPVEVVENKLVVEVTGKIIVVSENLTAVEDKLVQLDVQEVRFVCDVIHIDRDLAPGIWHGKNIVIISKILIIHDKVHWDVSGMNNQHIYGQNAGTGTGHHGQHGSDGHAGESGGNVWILVEKIQNAENLTIVSNGGNGSKGQDGGDGKDGKDGSGISKAEFDRLFPPVAAFIGLRRGVVTQVLDNIEGKFPKTEFVWCTNNSKTISGITKVGVKSIRKMPPMLNGIPDLLENSFVKVSTHEGNTITFSFEAGGSSRVCQAFLLYKGSPGEPGGDGGKYGLGGQGGYPGDITIKCSDHNPDVNQKLNVMNEAKQGEDGPNGLGGFYGKQGKNGWDIGYTDYAVSLFSNKWPKYFGTEKDSKFKLKYSDKNTKDRVWCPYKKKYAEIVKIANESKKQKRYEDKKSAKENRDRKHNAQAVRKKNISYGSILAKYSHHFNSVENTLTNLRADFESTKQQQLQTITSSTEPKITQHVTLNTNTMKHSFKRYERYVNFNTTVKHSALDFNALLEQLQQSLESWFDLKNIELTSTQLRELFDEFELLRKKAFQKDPEYKLKHIHQGLIEKYKLATLQDIANQISQLKQELTYEVLSLTPESIIRYLIVEETTDTDLNIDLQFHDQELPIKNHALKTFILEVGDSNSVHPSIKKYYNEHESFVADQHKRLHNIFTELKNKLSQPKHKETLMLWIESIKDVSLKAEVKKKTQSINSTRKIYEEFVQELERQYNWEQCCRDEDIQQEFVAHIREHGLLSGSYRELMAHALDLNLRLYAEDNGNTNLVLHDNHNRLAEIPIHVLYKRRDNDDMFIRLNVDTNYAKLAAERKFKNCTYEKILFEVKQLQTKEQFDDYYNNKLYLEDNVVGDSLDDSYAKDELINAIVQFFGDDERRELRSRLEKIDNEILANILMRFDGDGVHVSYKEMCFLINAILKSCIEGKKEENTFCWIVAAHSQRNWLAELILLELEDYFKKQLDDITKWRTYMSKVNNKHILLLLAVKLEQTETVTSIDCIDTILYLLSNITNDTVNLEGLELSEWSYVLKEKYWLCKLLPLTDWDASDELPTASYYLLSIETTFATNLVEELLKGLEAKKQDLTPEEITDILGHFYNEKWNLGTEELHALNNSTIGMFIEKMRRKFTANNRERDIDQLLELMHGNDNTSKTIDKKLSIIKDYIRHIPLTKDISEKLICDYTEVDITAWVDNFKYKSKNVVKYEFMLAIVQRAIELKRGFQLRDTQRLTILALLTNESSTLAQVSTGEGKSLIVVALSLVKALCSEKVNIITSSSVLAKRDAEGNTDIYNLFDVNVTHNCTEDIEIRKEVYSANQIIYGDLSSFQRDYLLDKFYGKNILGDNDLANVIVDEVDSMLLDQGNNMLYLSHDIAGLDKLESVYIFIWQWINRPAVTSEEIAYAFDSAKIKEAVISNLFGLVTIDDVAKLGGNELTKEDTVKIWEKLIDAGIIDDQGKLSNEEIDIDIDNLGINSTYKNRLGYLLNECVTRDKSIHIPNYLRDFVERHLDSWIANAKYAFTMKAGQDYVVDVDRAGVSSDRDANITIIDRDTGTDQANSQWDEVLHQFLQLKHGCKLSLQSLKAVFISNVSFFKLYKKLYGLTGTLGSRKERDLLREIHNVDFITIPTANYKEFDEYRPILCASKDEWITKIRDEVLELTETNNGSERSVLVICETVNDVLDLHKALGGKQKQTVHVYMRDYEELVIAQELEPKQIIIATNLAGRGTDINISEKLRESGGLHVCLTYLPSNVRIEQQAYGRAARNGDKGSGRLIFTNSTSYDDSNLKILDLKKARDEEESHRIAEIKTYYNTQITMEENCFQEFKERYEQLKKNLVNNKVPKNVITILMESCLDRWSFWLDENNTLIKSLQPNEQPPETLTGFISELKQLDAGYTENWAAVQAGVSESKPVFETNSWLAWVSNNPVQMVKLARYLTQHDQHKNSQRNAIKLFDDVILSEPYFAEAAHYYKAFALAKQGDSMSQDDFKHELRKAKHCFDEHCQFAQCAAGIIGKIKKNNKESIIQIDAYIEQQKSIANIYYIFSQSVDDILGHVVTPQSLKNYNISEELAENLFKDLIDKGILSKPSFNSDICEELEKRRLDKICYDSGVDTLKCFLDKQRAKHKGNIDEKEFQKALKHEILLPSREEFWRLLLQEEVLSNEVKYVVIDYDRLQQIDPSLYDILRQAEEDIMQTIELNHDQIMFNYEWISKEAIPVFKKQDFEKIVGRNKYLTLKDYRLLSFNKKANINRNKLKSVCLSSYDSITLDDLVSKAQISSDDANIILAELVGQGVLTKYKNTYRFCQLDQLKLSCGVYENAVMSLLSFCFTYRIALQIMIKQLEEQTPINLKLQTKPHKRLYFELLDQRIIRPTMVKVVESESLENELRKIYVQEMGRYEFKDMLLQNKLIPEKCNIEQLFNTLLEKDWIVRTNNVDRYRINSPDERKPLDFSEDDNIDKTVERIIDSRLQLVKELNNIVSMLRRLRCPMFNTDYLKLKSLDEIYGPNMYAYTGEVHVFSLNGLDQLLQLEEKKWTTQMIFNTAIVTSMGLSKTIICAAIELYYAGIMDQVGVNYIADGIHDLLYAVSALKSGYFRWNDYRQHKLESLAMIANDGVVAYLGRAVKGLAFGHKSTGSKMECQINTKRTVLVPTVKKAAVEIASLLDKAQIDPVLQNNIQALCNLLETNILAKVRKAVKSHPISKRLEKALKKLGEVNTRIVVDDLTKVVLCADNVSEQFVLLAGKIVSAVTNEITEIVRKKSKTNKWELPIAVIVKSTGCSAQIQHIVTHTYGILNDLELGVKAKSEALDLLSTQTQPRPSLQNQNHEEINKFIDNIINHWQTILCDIVKKIIAEHIISPITQIGAPHFFKYVAKNIQEGYQQKQALDNEQYEYNFFEKFRQLQHQEEQRLLNTGGSDNTSQTDYLILKQYNELKLLIAKDVGTSTHRTLSLGALGALDEINQKLFNIARRRVLVDPGNFVVKKHEAVLSSGDFGEIGLALYPVEIETVVNIWVQDVGQDVEYTIKMYFYHDHDQIEYEIIRGSEKLTTGFVKGNLRLPVCGKDCDVDNVIPISVIFSPTVHSCCKL